MKVYLKLLLLFIPGYIQAQNIHQSSKENISISEVYNTAFKTNKHWRGADGGATILLGNGKILWLFSDTFIDPEGTGQRSNSKMINNSIAIQDNSVIENSNLTFYYKKEKKKPKSFFELRGKNWFWTGHGTMVKDHLVIFLIEETATKKGIGFEAIGWYVAIIDNPEMSPNQWNIEYYKGPDTYGVIVGSSAVLADSQFVYAYGVKEPATHEVYLLKFDIDALIHGELEELDWWVNNAWTRQVVEEPIQSKLFLGQTEFSVHFDLVLNQYIQIQTYGMGSASLGYRLADHPQGPWSEPILFFTPQTIDQDEFVYTANAHPEIDSDGILISYNINNGNFNKLINNEEIYYPKLITLKLK